MNEEPNKESETTTTEKGTNGAASHLNSSDIKCVVERIETRTNTTLYTVVANVHANSNEWLSYCITQQNMNEEKLYVLCCVREYNILK